MQSSYIAVLRFLAAGLMITSLFACFQSRTVTLPSSVAVGPARTNDSSVQRAVHDAKAPRYTILDLGTLGGASGGAGGLNNRGWVAGTSWINGNAAQHEFLWRNGKMTDVGSVFGSLYSISLENGPVNDAGAVTGVVFTATPDPYGDMCGPDVCLPYVWRDGHATVLPVPGGKSGLALQINNGGEIVGTGEEPPRDPACVPPQVLDQIAVIWGPGENEIRELPPFGDDTEANAVGINDKGQIVGYSGNCKYSYGFGIIEAILWRDGRPINLGNLGFKLFNTAFSINNKGEVTGQAGTPRCCGLGGLHQFHAYLWRHGAIKDIGALPGDYFSLGSEINDKTQIVGLSGPRGNNAAHGFLWQNGAIYDLNTLTPKSADIQVVEALGINNRGQIAGYGFDTGTKTIHPFLATPCDAENPDIKGCEEARGVSRPIVLPESAQRMLMRLNALRHIYWPMQMRP